MAKGSRAAKWKHTSSLLALTANANSTGRRFKPSDFDPTAVKKAGAVVKLPPKESVSVLLEAFGVKRISSESR